MLRTYCPFLLPQGKKKKKKRTEISAKETKLQDQKNRWKVSIFEEYRGLPSAGEGFGDNNDSDTNIIARGFLPFRLALLLPVHMEPFSLLYYHEFFFFRTRAEIILVKTTWKHLAVTSNIFSWRENEFSNPGGYLLFCALNNYPSRRVCLRTGKLQFAPWKHVDVPAAPLQAPGEELST